ncbi:MAG TPA: hypothetical protein VIO16_08015 [Dehalococcoidia bacterium]
MKEFGEVITAFEAAGLDIRDAYWGYPHRATDGDRSLTIRVDGHDMFVSSVRLVDDVIIVEVSRGAADRLDEVMG